MKTTHNYTIGDKIHKVTFESGDLATWQARLGEARTLYFLHTWSCAHTGQSWFKKLAERASGKDAKQEDRNLFEEVIAGKVVDVIALMPKQQAETDWKDSLLARLKKLGGPLTVEGARLLELESNGWTEEQEEEWTDMLMGMMKKKPKG